ncbi:hypothetical protein IFM89_013116 [Coptis chinensis]|uniref:Uncharacterized protein n=1 Tax=Coptis chinensis TaxID=261450 RepID=A0A835MB42_9MAGN|nr:hypothetical protein IFM89_013116 [Coptis chinensis]
MRDGLDYIMLQYLDIDGIRIIGSVLGQSIALDYYVRQIDGMEKTGTFTMKRKKLFQLVGKVNSNLADVILKLGLFERRHSPIGGGGFGPDDRSLNVHLLNTRVEKFVEKIGYLQSLGLTNDEARRVCGRLLAIFGYSIENNLRGKVEYLVEEMERCVVEELKVFMQYFAFCLDIRIVPRHLHLKERNVDLSLQRMLLWSDQRFYAKWK